MKQLQERSIALFNHNLKTQMLQFNVEVGNTKVAAEDNVAAVEISDAAAGESTVTISAEDLAGDVSKIKSVEVLSSGASTVSASASLDEGNIVIELDSNANYTSAQDSIELRIVYKLK